MLRAGHTANRPCRGPFGDHSPGKRNAQGSYCGHLERPHHRCSLNVLLCELGHQAREAHQEDIPTSRTDTQTVFLCRPPLVEMAAVEVRVDLVDVLTVSCVLSRV